MVQILFSGVQLFLNTQASKYIWIDCENLEFVSSKVIQPSKTFHVDYTTSFINLQLLMILRLIFLQLNKVADTEDCQKFSR